MKRFIATMLVKNASEEVVPLFDLIVYGNTATEALEDPEGTEERLEARLKRRNLTLTDFVGYVIGWPAAVQY